jgi:hypothetical protein
MRIINCRTITILAALLLLADTDAARAQQCTYHECALRLEDNRIVAGQAGREVGRLNFLAATDLTQTFSVSDSAAAHYRVFRDYYGTGSLLSSISGATMTGVWVFRDRLSTGYEIGILLSALVVGALGGHHSRRAQQGLSRAMWWYNLDLPR